MAKLKFGAWIPTYAWSGEQDGPEERQRIRESIVKCEKHGIDVWVIDHLLSAPGPLRQRLARAAELARLRGRADREGQDRHGHPGAAGAPPGGAGQGDLDPLPPLGQPLHVRRRPRLVRAGVRGDRLAHRGAREAHRRDHRGGDAAADQAERVLPGQVLPVQRRDHRARARRRCRPSGSRAARACPTRPTTTCRSSPPRSWTASSRPATGSRAARASRSGSSATGCSSQQHAKAHGQATRRSSPSGTATSPTSWTRRATTRRWPQSKAPFLRAMGTHRSYEHLQECYMVGGDRPHQHADRRPAEGGARVPRAGAGDRRSEADRPHGQEGREALQVAASRACDTASTCPPAARPPRRRRSRPWCSAGRRSASPR